MLDREYDEHRDIRSSDGGFVLLAENVADLQELHRYGLNIQTAIPEQVNLLKTEPVYLNALYFMNNEFGINLFLPLSIAPDILLSELEV